MCVGGGGECEWGVSCLGSLPPSLIRLPIETASGESVYAEASHNGKKKDAVVMCALNACRMLDAQDMLRHHAKGKYTLGSGYTVWWRVLSGIPSPFCKGFQAYVCHIFLTLIIAKPIFVAFFCYESQDIKQGREIGQTMTTTTVTRTPFWIEQD